MAHTASKRIFSICPGGSNRNICKRGKDLVFSNENYYRCQSVGLGSSLGGLAGPGSLAARGGMPVIKFQRTCSSGECFNCSGGEGQFKRPVDFFSDNATTVAYLNKQGGTRSDTLLLLSQQILSWAENNVSSVRAVHISGTVNVLVDYLSRVNISTSSWELKTRSRRSC